MQRLTKYPLLLDNIAKYTGTEELYIWMRARPVSLYGGGDHIIISVICDIACRQTCVSALYRLFKVWNNCLIYLKGSVCNSDKLEEHPDLMTIGHRQIPIVYALWLLPYISPWPLLYSLLIDLMIFRSMWYWAIIPCNAGKAPGLAFILIQNIICKKNPWVKRWKKRNLQQRLVKCQSRWITKANGEMTSLMVLKHRCTLQEMTQPLLGLSFLPWLRVPHREATNNKVYQLPGPHNAPVLYHNFWGGRCVNGQRKCQFHGQPPAGITSQCPNIFQIMQLRRRKWSRQQIAVERFSITSTRLWRDLRTSRCDIFSSF